MTTLEREGAVVGRHVEDLEPDLVAAERSQGEVEAQVPADEVVQDDTGKEGPWWGRIWVECREDGVLEAWAPRTRRRRHPYVQVR